MKQHPSFLARQAKARQIAAAFERDQKAEDYERAFDAFRYHPDHTSSRVADVSGYGTIEAVDPKRRRMLRDIMITAFEGGSNYWAEARNVVRDDTPDEGLAAYDPGSVLDQTGRHHGDYVSFEVRSAEDADDKRLGKWHRIDEQAVERGLALILSVPQTGPLGMGVRNPVGVRRDILAALALANVSPEDADLDADAADCVIQAAAFGEIVYG